MIKKILYKMWKRGVRLRWSKHPVSAFALEVQIITNFDKAFETGGLAQVSHEYDEWANRFISRITEYIENPNSMEKTW